MGVKFGMEEGTEGHAKFHPIGATCRPCEAKNLKIGLLSKLNTGRLALCAMLPPIKASGSRGRSFWNLWKTAWATLHCDSGVTPDPCLVLTVP